MTYGKWIISAVVGSLLAAVLYAASATSPNGDPTQPRPDREKLLKLMAEGNYKDAYDGLSVLVLDKEADVAKVSEDFNNAVACLQSLQRIHEFDAFAAKAIEAHGDNWRLLWAAAKQYMNVPHGGFIISGEYWRGGHRGGGRAVSSFERDLVRALQLMQQVIPLTSKLAKEDQQQVAQFYMELANMLLDNRGYGEAWRLQYLTDLGKLPDYDEGYDTYEYIPQAASHFGGRGAPVDDKGEPVFHSMPKSWEDAQTDGQRWRWCLAQAMEYGRREEALFSFAQFLHNQFGVQTMAGFGGRFGRLADDEKKNESGPYDVSTLGEDETIARLASGIKRFKLPDEFNFIRVYQQLASDGKGYAEQSLEQLAQIFENRQQYAKAADYWRQDIERFGAGVEQWKQKRLDQIVGNWGFFEPILAQPAGQGASVEFRFRNAQKVNFVAQEIDIAALLADVKEYIRSRPKQLEWEKLQIDNIGYQLVQGKQQKYLLGKAAEWELKLQPRPNHFDRRITVATPLQKAGAYLLTANMEGGNTSSVVIWLADTAIVKKPLDQKSYVFVADAAAGDPLAKVNVEFFGYRQRWVEDKAATRRANRGGHYEIDTSDFAEFTDGDGQIILDSKQLPQDYQYLIIATTPKEQDGRLAYLGFTGVWYSQRYEEQYNQTKVFVMTDRPVYRPAQTVKFKAWVTRAQYDAEGNSPFARQKFHVQVNDPKGEKVFEKDLAADDLGGFDSELTLGKEATLGVYSIRIPSHPGADGVGTFRLEEYKKPEFEVKVEAPKEPVMLGEKITATIQAKYLFGAPVKEAKVKYKVLRSNYSNQWWPITPWDWFYGRGYWWFCYDYTWYPGWAEWGCPRPVPAWWHWAPRQQPEIVAEAEVPVGPDGSVKVDIDTAVAKAVLGDTDHKYEITAEVTDQSRRTIAGSGQVLVARRPFKTYVWVTRGHYRVGDDIDVRMFAQTLDSKGVKGKGELKLLAVNYQKDKDSGRIVPVETEVQKWQVDTGEDGCARQQIKASKAGQYRLSYTLTDAKGHAIEGGYVFCIIGQGFDSSDFRFNDLELVTDQQQYKSGDKVQLMINTNRSDTAVVLFIRPTNGIGLPPKVLRLKGKSVMEEIEVLKKDMPNFFVEAFTVSGGKVHSEMREVAVPPESRMLDVKAEVVGGERGTGVTPVRGMDVSSMPAKQAKEKQQGRDVPETHGQDVRATHGQDAHATGDIVPRFKPGEKTQIKIKLTDATGEPFVGSAVVTMYDKAVEYISGGSNVPDIKEFFWKWRRRHSINTETSLNRGSQNMTPPKMPAMGFLGVFGYLTAEMDKEGLLGRDGDDYGIASGGAGVMLPGKVSTLARSYSYLKQDGEAMPSAAAAPAPMMAMKAKGEVAADALAANEAQPGGGGEGPAVEPTVRTNFADTAFWAAAVTTGKDGTAVLDVTMPESLTTWKTKVWAMGSGARCGQAETEVITTKNVIIRLQAPRFFVQTDEVVLSANVHNYLKTTKRVRVLLELSGGCLELLQDPTHGSPKRPEIAALVDVEASGEKRVDWRVKVVQPGEATIRVKAITDEESDAAEMKFPVLIHGMLKTESFSGVIPGSPSNQGIAGQTPAPQGSPLREQGEPGRDGLAIRGQDARDTDAAGTAAVHAGETPAPRTAGETPAPQLRASSSFMFTVPENRKPQQSRLEIRYSPSLAGAMVDALPYLVDYPYGCTEQTLNRFLPTVITQKVLINMGLDLKDIQAKRTNLNAQEIGDDAARAKDWAYRGGYMSRATARVKEGVFDEADVRDMVKAGLERLQSMQCSDGGWGWFSGYGEQSYPHTTAVVVHGMQIARANDVALVPGVLEKGIEWLRRYQDEQVLRLQNAEKKVKPWKDRADNIDALVYMVLVDEKIDNKAMREFLYRDRNDLAVYAKAMLGLACHKVKDVEKRDMLIRNCQQFLVRDAENQTAYLDLGAGNLWWCWYGSEYEAQAYYLKLLCATDPKGDTAPALVKYLINNRKHATYWNSTRDTAIVIEALADYIKASGEDKPDMTLSVLIDGKSVKEVKINKDNLFSFDNKVVMEGAAITTGRHKVELVRKGTGSVYYNAYLTNFTLEDFITKAGLEIKVDRKFYKLVEVDKKVKAEGAHGQVLDQKVVKYERQELKMEEVKKGIGTNPPALVLPGLKSGDLVEVELTIDSKNDYEYIVFEDMKAAGMEAVEVRSGYNGNDMGAYVEFRDERVVFFVRSLARGTHSLSYRLRAEIPGKFSALPTKASAMYAPELRGNSDEFKVKIED